MNQHATISSAHDAYVMVYDDTTRDRLALLEKVQEGHDWRVQIVAEDASATEALVALGTGYQRNACSTVITTDDHQRTILEIHHLGRESSIEDGFAELGLAQGSAHALRKVRAHISEGLGGVRSYMDTPMKILSGLYAFGDVMSGVAGFFDKTPDGSKPDPLLQRLKFTTSFCNVLQSFIFIKYGQDDSIHHLYLLNQEIERQLAAGNDRPLDALNHAESLDRIANPALKSVHQFLMDHPMETGVAAWNTGQALFFTSGLMRWLNNRDDKDALIDMARSVVSFTGWCMLLVPKVHTEEKTPFFDNPIERIRQEIQEAPQHLSGMGAMGASLVSMNSSNPVQKMAEASFLAGDVSMFFLENEDYGEKSRGNPKALTEAICTFLERVPIVFSPTTQRDFVKALAEYLAQRAENTLSRKDKHIMDGLAEIVQQHVAVEMTTRHHRFEQIAAHTASLIALFPEQQRSELQETLCTIVEQSSAVQVDAQELRQEVQRQNTLLPPLPSPESAPPISALSEAIAKLTFSLPPLGSTDNAMRLFEATAAYRIATPAHDEIFQKTMVNYVASELGIAPKQIHALAREGEAHDRGRMNHYSA